MKDFWNSRYSEPTSAYGTTPNAFLKQQLAGLEPGTALFAAEGEGRNAVYAATLGWQVSAFDLSEAGKTKAEGLAQAHRVQLDYQVGDCMELNYPETSFDLIALIYAHFPGPVKSACHRRLATLLKPGGRVIFEAFAKSHLAFNSVNPKVGGPKDEATLFSTAELEQDFAGFEIRYLAEETVELSEGLYHNGKSSVIRLVGIKL
ncbi:MAG: methyltransferase domain-containing protein [Bacteroidia bacterium]|nr:methyltransferase domain-containing protein [Bacteroidia bacterium]